MAALTRFDPFDEAVNDLLRGFFVRPMTFERPETASPFRMDVKEDEKAYTVQAELPGVKKEAIQVSIDGNQVSVSVEVKRESEEKDGERLLRRERHYGKVARAFTLGQDIDEANAQAKYNDGVLELILPKKAAVAAKRLTIQ